jgi:hypothetical protein
MAQFHAEQASVTAENLSPLGSKVDFRLWSVKRIETYEVRSLMACITASPINRITVYRPAESLSWLGSGRHPDVVRRGDFRIRNVSRDAHRLETRLLIRRSLENEKILVVEDFLETIQVRLETDGVLKP